MKTITTKNRSGYKVEYEITRETKRNTLAGRITIYKFNEYVPVCKYGSHNDGFKWVVRYQAEEINGRIFKSDSIKDIVDRINKTVTKYGMVK